MGKQPDEKIRLGLNGADELSLKGLMPHEKDYIEGMLAGVYRLEVVDGRLVKRDKFEDPRGPIEDPICGEQWSLKTEPKVRTEAFSRVDHAMSPSIIIESLCGYNYTPENYQRAALKLTSYGFICLRSRRGRDGKYWELWYLPGFWAAEGELRRVVEDSKYRHTNDTAELYKAIARQIERVTHFIAQTVQFGSLDIIYQRMAMVID